MLGSLPLIKCSLNTYHPILTGTISPYTFVSFSIFMQRVKHSKIADNLDAALDSKKYLLAGMDSDQTEMCFSPIIQSGENYSLKFSATRLVTHIA